MVCGVDAGVGREPRPQELVELPATLAGEHPGLGRRGNGPQVRDRPVGRVVQVGDARERIGLVGQDRDEVGEIARVPGDLQRRVQHRAVPGAIDVDQGGAVLPAPRRAPLLELDDHVRRRARARVGASQDHVGPLGREREPVLGEHLDRP